MSNLRHDVVLDGHPHYKVHPKEITENGTPKYDTVSDIAAAWLHANPKQGEFHGSFQTKLNQVVKWIIKINHLKTHDGKECVDTDIWVAVIHANQMLTLPKGHGIQAAHMHEENCTVETNKNPYKHHHETQAAPPPETTEENDETHVINKEPPPKPAPKPINPHYYAFQESSATNGKKWVLGTTNHAIELYMRSGLDEEATRAYYREQLAVRDPAVWERHSGDTKDFVREGDRLGKENLSRKDDKNQKHDDGTGAKTTAWSVVTGGRTRVFNGGFVTVNADGDMDRSDHNSVSTYWTNNAAFTMHVPFKTFVIPVGNSHGAGISNPSKQTNLSAYTEAGGLTEVNTAFAKLNQMNKTAVFTDEQTMRSNLLASPDRIYARMFELNSKKAFEEKMQAFIQKPCYEDAKGALIALRDYEDVFTVKSVDSYRAQLDQTELAVRKYFKDNGFADDGADKMLPTREELRDLKQYPRLEVVDMKKELKTDLHDYNISGKGGGRRYGDIHPGETNAAYTAAESIAYRTMNSFELEVAKGTTAVPKEKDMVSEAHDAWDVILKKGSKTNVASITEVGKFIATNRNAQVSFSALLHDMDRNWKNYGFNNKRQAVDLIGTMLGDNKSVHQDVTTKGNSSPILFLRDKPFAEAHPEEVGETAGAAIQANPDAFRLIMEHATNIDARALEAEAKEASDGQPGIRGKSAHSDHRRYAVGLLGTYAREIPKAEDGVVLEDGVDPKGFTDLANSVGGLYTSNGALLYDATHHALLYSDSSYSGVNRQGHEMVDNKYTAAQQADLAHQADLTNPAVDLKKTYEDIYLSDDKSDNTKDAHSAQIGTTGVFAKHKLVGEDAVFLTLMYHPEAFDPITDKHHGALHDLAQSTIGGRNNVERRKLAHIQHLAEEYSSLDPSSDEAKHIWERAGKIYGKLYAKIERRIERDNKHAHDHTERKMGLFENALEGLITSVGADPKLSTTIMETAEKDPRLVTAILQSTPEALGFTDAVNHTHMSGDYLSQTDNIYKQRSDVEGEGGSLYIQFNRNKRGHIKHGKKGIEVKGDPTLNTSAMDGALAKLSPEEREKMKIAIGYSETSIALHTNKILILGSKEIVDSKLSAEEIKEAKITALALKLQETYKVDQTQIELDPCSHRPKDIKLFYQELARGMIDNNLITTRTDGSDLIGEIDGQAILATITQAEGFGAVRGFVAKRYALALLPLLRSTHTITTTTYQHNPILEYDQGGNAYQTGTTTVPVTTTVVKHTSSEAAELAAGSDVGLSLIPTPVSHPAPDQQKQNKDKSPPR